MNIAPHLDRQRLLTEDTADTRIVVVAKRAARSLLASGRPVTRSSLVAEAKRIDEKRQNKPHGLSEASIDANLQVREIYEAVRTWKAPRKSYRSGRIDPQIRRLAKRETITALLLGRLATQERMNEFNLAKARYRGTSDTTAIVRAFAEREAMRTNRIPAKQPSGLERASKEKRDGSMRRIRNAIRNEGCSTNSAIARAAGVDLSTVERFRASAVQAKEDARVGIDHQERLRLMRLPKRELHRALHIERALIRALNAETLRMAADIVAHDRQRIRAEASSVR